MAILIAALSQVVNAQQSVTVAPQLNAVQTSKVERWAKVYDIPASEALNNYRLLLDTKRAETLKALDFFDRKNAFEIAAAALLDAKNDSIAGTVLYTLERKKDFSRTAFDAAMTKLVRLNNGPMDDISDFGEHGAGIETVKARLATVISKWIGIPDPDFMHSPACDTIDGSKAAYRVFIAQAKLKAQGITEDSPF